MAPKGFGVTPGGLSPEPCLIGTAQPTTFRITTRIAEPCDAAFAYEVREKAMREYEQATWGRWDVARTQRQIEHDIAASILNIIEVDLRIAGMMRIDQHPTHIHLDQLFLLPEYQNRGIGTKLVEDVLRGARLMNLPVKLWVLQVNPARRLYERLGFQVVEITAASLYLQSAV
jgi:GNAT superfamily N-acetyltransferase